MGLTTTTVIATTITSIYLNIEMEKQSILEFKWAPNNIRNGMVM